MQTNNIFPASFNYPYIIRQINTTLWIALATRSRKIHFDMAEKQTSVSPRSYPPVEEIS